MPGGRGGVASANWFEDTFGFKEKPYDETRRQFEFADGVLTCKANSKSFQVGSFEVLSLEDLRARLASAAAGTAPGGGLSFRNIVGDARALHRDAANAGMVFQVASQFNCLEMNEPGARPENGVTRYASDATQGPACALACPAGTVFRNYLVHGGQGQGGKGHQIDCLAGVGELVTNNREKFWRMANGYCLPTATGSIGKLSERIAADGTMAEAVRSRVRVGIHWDTEVAGSSQRVCQVFCSALPVAYAKHEKSANWMPFACAVLDACFEAALASAALLALQRGSRVRVFLTAVGGGAFGNRSAWIVSALEKALAAHAASPIDVMLVHFATLPRGAYKGLESSRRSPAAPRATRSTGPEQQATRSTGQAQQAEEDGGRASGPAQQQNAPQVLEGGTGRCPTTSQKPTQPQIAPRVPEGGAGQCPTTGQKLTAAFSALDANGDGVIARAELLSVLQQVDAKVFTEEAVDTILQAADANGDGQIHYAEFAAWVCSEDPSATGCMIALGSESGARVGSSASQAPQPPVEQPQGASSSLQRQATRLEPAVSGADDDSPWPLAKLRAALDDWQGPVPKMGFAVLLGTGAMNPAHRGHVQLLYQAKDRLEAAGFGILGAWLSPSHDGYVQPKAQATKTVGLSAGFRLQVARHAVAHDGLVAIGSWEATKAGHWPDYPEVAKALQDELNRQPEASRLQGRCKTVQVFYACGTDHAQKCSLYRGLRPERRLGVVVVPRSGERAQREKPDDLVYVAEPAAGEVAGFSSTKVREALGRGDFDFLSRALSPESAELLLRPSAEWHAAFRDDFKKLRINPI